ncbi:MAG: hypothetical protein JO110_05710 [Acetobacteraceae bacterium]|nr:hypothetical protein [Acetobacteraceae bacterium]
MTLACGCVHYLFMSLAPSQPATSLSHRLGLTLAGLCEALAARMAKDRDAVLLLFMAWTRLRRFVFRFEALLADFRAGRLSAAPSPRGGGDNLPQLPGLAGLPQPRLPRAFGWLLRLAPESAAFAGQVERLLADPEMKALLAGSAQASRMLRAAVPDAGDPARAGAFSAAARGTAPSWGAAPARGGGLAQRRGRPVRCRSTGRSAGGCVSSGRYSTGFAGGSRFRSREHRVPFCRAKWGSGIGVPIGFPIRERIGVPKLARSALAAGAAAPDACRLGH